MKTVKEIDLEKHKIEAVFIPPLRRIFNHLANDAKALYLATKRIPAKSLADNYRPEFLTIIRQAQRETIKQFGFSIREGGQKKGYAFKTEKNKALINYQIQTKDVDIVLEPEAEQKINQEFALEAALFVANSTETQADYITATNEKEINEAEKLAVILFFNTQTKLEGKIRQAQEEIRQIELNRLFGASPSISDAKKNRLEEKIAKLEVELEELNKNKDIFIADKIENKIIKDGASRSELIASQNVGMAESFARNKEAQLVNDNILEADIKKRWSAILDSHTRLTHSEADNQTVGINEKFTVGGYKADYPRDESLPIEETANCRCVAFHFWGEDLAGN
jgi:hypothetical protein